MKIMTILIIGVTLVMLSGCARTLYFLSDVDPDLTYNNQERKWEQKQK